MAYGTSTIVVLLLGKEDAIIWDSTAIAAAIVVGDTWVDSINSDATAEEKTLASSHIAVEYLKTGRSNYRMKGVGSTGGTAGSPPITPGKDFEIPAIVYKILQSSTGVYDFSNVAPSVTGKWS